MSGSAEFSSRQQARSPYLIVGAATLLNMISYVDRSCISVAAPSIGREFGLTPTQLGIVFSSFFLSYALLQMPWGAAADRVGPRKIVTFAILAWSACTALTGAALNYLMLVIVRVAFGGLEAALNPSITTALARWVPDNWRATAFGIFIGGGRVGGAFAPAAVAFLLLRYGWRSSFVAIAAAGVLGAVVWLFAVPANLPVNSASRTFEQAGVRLWSFRMTALLLVVFGYTFMWQFYATWFPTYLIERRGYTLGQAAWYASLPFLLGIGSNWIGGILCDAISRKIGPALGRGILGFCSILFAALLFYCGIVGSAASSPWLLAAAAGVGDLFLPIAWTVAADLGGKSAGAFAGLMNTASNLGGFVSPILLGAAVQHWKNWDSALLIGVGATLLAAFLWIPVNWQSRTDARLAI